MAGAFNSSTCEAKPRGSLSPRPTWCMYQVLGQSVLPSETLSQENKQGSVLPSETLSQENKRVGKMA